MNLPQPDKDVLITGASGVIGSAIARQLAAHFNLHLTSRDMSKLQGLAGELTKTGSRISVYTMNLADPTHCQDTVRQFFVNAKKPYGLVCNAGHLGVLGRFDEIDFADWQQSIVENFLSHAAMIHAFVAGFRAERRRTGSIVILSGAGLGGPVTHTRLTSYLTAKAALTHLAEALSAELIDLDITINAVAPGQVRSGITDQAIAAGPARAGDYALSAQKCKQTGGVSPELAADLIDFLMGPQARGITGRLLSARFDLERLKQNLAAVARNPALYRLRRIDNDLFGEIKR
jgi:NAD(P)-dependent dehydrogenase (short-subunit alcohol dehydrogenase family)